MQRQPLAASKLNVLKPAVLPEDSVERHSRVELPPIEANGLAQFSVDLPPDLKQKLWIPTVTFLSADINAVFTYTCVVQPERVGVTVHNLSSLPSAPATAVVLLHGL
jgi:hypothetical protein